TRADASVVHDVVVETPAGDAHAFFHFRAVADDEYVGLLAVGRLGDDTSHEFGADTSRITKEQSETRFHLRIAPQPEGWGLHFKKKKRPPSKSLSRPTRRDTCDKRRDDRPQTERDRHRRQRTGDARTPEDAERSLAEEHRLAE